MKRNLFILVTMLALAALACSPGITINVPRATTGPTETLTISEPRPSGETVTDVVLEMGAGRLNVAGGADGLANGTVRYNVPAWKPTVTNQDGKLTISQGPIQSVSGDNVINEWDLKLGSVPMRLLVNAGAYEGKLELGGLRLRRLEINDGASRSDVEFATDNPEEMDELYYKTGASQVSLTGLAHANFTRLTMRGGAGDFTLDFGGTLRRDATVDVEAGMSTLTIIVPSGMSAKVVVGGGMHDVSTEGPWSQSGDTYSVSGSGPTLTMNIEVGMGKVTLISR